MGEIGEPLTVVYGIVVGIIVAKDRKDGSEGVEGKQGADEGEKERWKKPRCGIGVGRIERGGDAESGVKCGHFLAVLRSWECC